MAEGAVDDLSERVKEAVRSSTVKLPLVHSQYLHRCSLYSNPRTPNSQPRKSSTLAPQFAMKCAFTWHEEMLLNFVSPIAHFISLQIANLCVGPGSHSLGLYGAAPVGGRPRNVKCAQTPSLCHSTSALILYQRTCLSCLVILPLGRESIYLADLIFLDAMSNGKAVILEKTMTTYSQVCP